MRTTHIANFRSWVKSIKAASVKRSLYNNSDKVFTEEREKTDIRKIPNGRQRRQRTERS